MAVYDGRTLSMRGSIDDQPLEGAGTAHLRNASNDTLSSRWHRANG